MKATIKTLLASAALATLALTAAASASAAEFGLKNLSFSFRDENGAPAMQAGSHPFELVTTLEVNTELDPELGEVPVDAVKDLRIELPPGFVGTPKATPRCSGADFVNVIHSEKVPSCSNSSAVGVAALRIGDVAPEFQGVPVYNLVPSPGMAAKLGFIALGVPVTIDLRVKETFPYNVVAELTDIAQPVRFYGSVVSIWGNPADPIHDPIRGNCVAGVFPTLTYEIVSKGNCPVDMEEVPFLTAPRRCAGPLAASFEAHPWQNPALAVFGQALTSDDSNPPQPVGFGGCGLLGFAPTILAQPTNRSASGPTGLDFDLNIKDEGLSDPKVLAQSDITKAEVTLPEGMTINPSQAEGLGVCSEADLERESAASEPGDGCPQSSKVGTVEVETPLLKDEVIKGNLYVAEPYKNLTGSLIAIYMVLKDRGLGISVKLPGKVSPDPETGQLITTFENLPELPFSHFHLHFREGGRSPLITPPACGTYTVEGVFTPAANPANPYRTTSSFEVTSGVGGGPCPPADTPPFDPGFTAGAINNNAGSYSPFTMRLTRNDGDQDITRFSAVLPPGVTGKLAGIPQCPSGAVATARAKSGLEEKASPSCPAASRIGGTLAGAGVGSQLTYVPGDLYLGGPYKGAPLSVIAIVPAVAGPFDVGTVVVQVGLNLNPSTAEVEVDGASSDPIPHILAGIPLKVRDLRVSVDRPDFTLNPTSCDPSSTRAQIWGGGSQLFSSADDVAVARTNRFQAANCANLAFKPSLKLRLKGATKRGGNPAFKATYKSRPKDANLKGAEVILPRSQFIDNAHINNPCTRPQFAQGKCPKGSILGRARAFTPLLDNPLEGPVYFLSNGGERKLPDVVAALDGQFRFNLVIAILEARNARVRTKVLNAPDAPVTRFLLNMAGGKRGLLENSQNLCRRAQRADLILTGQNNKRYATKPAVKTSCKKKQPKRSKKRR